MPHRTTASPNRGISEPEFIANIASAYEHRHGQHITEERVAQIIYGDCEITTEVAKVIAIKGMFLGAANAHVYERTHSAPSGIRVDASSYDKDVIARLCQWGHGGAQYPEDQNRRRIRARSRTPTPR